MATVREIRARFVGEVSALKTALRQVQQEASNLGPAVQRSTEQANRSYTTLGTNATKLRRILQESGAADLFQNLNRSAEQAQREFEATGRVSAATMDQLQRDADQAGQSFDNMSAESRASFAQMETALSAVRTDLNLLGGSANDAAADLNNLGGNNNLNNLSGDINNAGDALNDLQGDAGQAEGAVDDVTQSIEEMGAAGTDSGGLLAGSFKGIAAGAVGIVAGLATAIGGVGMFIKGADDLQRVLNGMEAATGATKTEMNEMRDSLENIYGKNYGESFQDIGDSMTYVKQATGLSGIELEKMTQNGLMLRDTFQYEVNESVRAASTLMERFGLSGEEAYALIAEGSQKGLNYADDLLDTINEYSVYYEQAGFSAQEMFGMFENAKKNKTFNLDYAADAFKEFGIIMTEDSERAVEALGLVGLNGKQLREEFAQGGDTAKGAFQKITKGLEAMKDPEQQRIAGVELFGTKFEDLGVDAVLAMSQANDSITGTTDVLKEIDAVKYNTIGEAIKGMGRGFIVDVMLPLQEKVMPYVNAAFNGFRETVDKARAGLKPFQDGFKTLKDVISGLFTDDGEKGRDLLKTLGFSQEMITMIDGYAAKLAGFHGNIKTFTAGVRGLFNDDGQEGRDLLAQLGFSPSLISKMDAFAANFSAFRNNISGVIQGLLKLFQGDRSGGYSILDSLGFTPDFIQKADRFVEKVKSIASQVRGAASSIAAGVAEYGPQIWNTIKKFLIDIWPVVKSAVSGVASFMLGIIQKIAQFWSENGSQILQAATNIFNGIMAVIKFVMPVVLAIIKSVWGNIKGVITGALDIIMGVVKIFSGLFTGDFKKMWEGVKQLFFGAVNFIWNFVQLTFYGKILGGAKAFFLAFKGGFAAMWTGVKALFTGGVGAAWTTIKAGWAQISTATTNTFKAIWSFLSGTFTAIKNIFSAAVKGYFNLIRGGWTLIFNTTKNVFMSVFNFFKSIFGSIRTAVSGAVSGIWTNIKNTWSLIFGSTTTTFRNIYNAIKGRFTDIVNAAKALPGKIGDGIGMMAGKVTAGVTKVINALARTLGKGVNGVIGGVNWVLGKIGSDTKVSKWTVPQYAQGTGKHPGGLAVVGDGVGDNAGPEMIQHPDGSSYLSPSNSTLVNLPKGAKVWSAKVTRDLFSHVPHYAMGDMLRTAKDWVGNKASHVWAKTKDVGSKIKSAAVDVFDYLKNPGKLLDVALSALGFAAPGGSGLAESMTRGAISKVKNGAVNYVKGKLADFGGGDAGGFGSRFGWSSSYGWRIHPITGKRTFHNGADLPASQGTPIPAQVGGRVTQSGYHGIRGNYVRIQSGNMERIYQHNLRNLVGVGDMVKQGQTVGLVGSTGSSTGPHLHYEVLRNGKNINPKGYKDGGVVGLSGPELAWLAEGGFAESVISHDPAKRGTQEQIWQRTGQMLGFNSGGQDSGLILNLLARIAKAVEAGHNIIMDEQVVAEILKDPLSKLQQLDDEIATIYKR